MTGRPPAFPKEILSKHTAIFGMTGSGKSTTARDLVEQVVPEGSRVCILDTVKSDWWGITSSADGKKAGLPFTILGGPHAHLPLSRNMGKAVGEMVATGALPLSIIDMVDFGMGDPAHFFVDFAQALMRKMKGVLYLVIEEAHELAPKERAGFDKENLGVYWAKKLAIAGRTKGLRLVVCSQRVQSLHNAVIGSCETMVVHRMTAPADQKPVVDWLKGNVKDAALRKSIEEQMSSLADGQGYMCSGSAKIFELIQFPRAKTFDNTATPEDDSALQDVKTAAIDVEALRSLLGEAVKEAEANDPAALKKRIAELERDIRKGGGLAAAILAPAADHSKCVPAAQLGAIAAQSRKEGWDKAIEEMKRCHQAYVQSVTTTLSNTLGGVTLHVTEKAMEIYDGLEYSKAFYEEDRKAGKFNNPLRPARQLPSDLIEKREKLAADVLNRGFAGDGVALTSVAHPKGNGKTPRLTLNPKSLETISIEVALTPVQQKIIDALYELEQMRIRAPAADLLAFFAGYANLRSKGFTNAIGSLRSGGMVDGTALTDAGRAAANPPTEPMTAVRLQQRLITMLGGATGRILAPLVDVYPDTVERAELARAAGYENERSKGFVNAVGRLRTLGFVEYQGREVVARPVLFMQ